MTDTPREKIFMSLEAFLALPESHQRTELINGEVIVSPAPHDYHQKVVTLLPIVLAPLVQIGELRVAPVDVVIDGVNVVQPDVLWVSRGNLYCTMRDGQWHGAPDLIIEVLSPSTSDYDKETKYKLYERSGVHEYWLVDIPRRLIHVYVRQGSNFTHLGDFGLNQVFDSPVMNHQTVHVNAILGWLE